MDQREFMSGEYEFSTYGKLGFDATASKVLTVNLGSMPLSDTDCSGRGFAIAELASAAAKLEGAEDIDGVMYYLPEGELTPACGGSAWGTLGICSVGQLTDVNDKRAEATTPPYVVRTSSSGLNERRGSALSTVS